MSDIPLTCYDGLYKRFKCDKCGFCVSYTMGKRSFIRFKKHYINCNEPRNVAEHPPTQPAQ